MQASKGSSDTEEPTERLKERVVMGAILGLL